MYPGFGKASGPTGPPGSQPLFGNFGGCRPPSPSPPTTPLFRALLRCVLCPGMHFPLLKWIVVGSYLIMWSGLEKNKVPTCSTPLFHPIAYNPSFVSLYNVSREEVKGLPRHKFSGRSACSHWNNLNSDVRGIG